MAKKQNTKKKSIKNKKPKITPKKLSNRNIKKSKSQNKKIKTSKNQNFKKSKLQKKKTRKSITSLNKFSKKTNINTTSKKINNQRTQKQNVPIQKKTNKKILEKYIIEVDSAKAQISIVEDKEGSYYNIEIPKLSEPSKALLDEIRNQLIMVTTIKSNEIVDPEAFIKLKKRFKVDAQRLIQQNLKNVSKEVLDFLTGRLMIEMLGLGELEFLINDPRLEEIVVPSSKEPIRVYYQKYGWLKTSLKIDKEEQILNYSDIVARRVGRQITVLSPLLDAHLLSGDRVNSVLYPISTKGNTITIRRFSRNPITIIDLIKTNTCSDDVAALLWLAIEYEMNILISGGTASGKTSFLNACLPFIPPKHRILSIEDTRELMLPDFLYWTPLVTRTPNPEGKGGISMLDLLINSLRMRPDRIILGEMRKEEEARVLFEAMHTGHSVYATLHADSAPETISRLTNPPLNVPPNLLKSVHLNVVMFRDRKSGLRRVLQLAEIDAGSNTAHANLLYRWTPENDKIVKHAENPSIFEDLSRMTGMSNTQINNNLLERKKIFAYLIKENIRSLEDFGEVMKLYYLNKEKLTEAIRKNNLKTVLGIK